MSWVHVYCTVSGGAGHTSQIDENQEYLFIHVASKFISGWKEGGKAKVWNVNVNCKSNGSFICCFIRCCPCWHSMEHEIQPESLPSCQKKFRFHTFFNKFTHFDYVQFSCMFSDVECNFLLGKIFTFSHTDWVSLPTESSRTIVPFRKTLVVSPGLWPGSGEGQFVTHIYYNTLLK